MMRIVMAILEAIIVTDFRRDKSTICKHCIMDCVLYSVFSKEDQ